MSGSRGTSELGRAFSPMMILLALGGCGGSRPAVRPLEPRPIPESPLRRAIETPRVSEPSSDQATPPVGVEPTDDPLPGSSRVYPSQEPFNRPREGAPEAFPPPTPAPGRASGSASPASGGGYAVQLLASSSLALAEERRRELERSFGAAVWIETSHGLHRVRVGRCRERTEAEALRREAVRLGCEDAFVVRYGQATP